MPVKKLENIEKGSVICDPEDPKQIFKVIEKITVFPSHDQLGDTCMCIHCQCFYNERGFSILRMNNRLRNQNRQTRLFFQLL